MSCTTCKHGKFERTATGRPKRNIPGRCQFKLGALVVPIVMTIQPRVTAIWPDMGDDCPAHETESVLSATAGTEQQLHAMLTDLRQDYERRAAPILKTLAQIAAMSPVPPVAISIAQAIELGLIDRPTTTGNES